MVALHLRNGFLTTFYALFLNNNYCCFSYVFNICDSEDSDFTVVV